MRMFCVNPNIMHKSSPDTKGSKHVKATEGALTTRENVTQQTKAKQTLCNYTPDMLFPSTNYAL
jgi:hypothetical protein